MMENFKSAVYICFPTQNRWIMFLYGLLYKRFELEVLKHFYVEIFELFRLKTVFFVILSKVLKPHVKLIFYKVSFVVG